VVAERVAYALALERGDPGTARHAARRLSQAQSRVDSLVAEAMLQETSVLSPNQRSRYVLWTFRPERGRHRGHALLPPREERN
jgi:hypothetical protein